MSSKCSRIIVCDFAVWFALCLNLNFKENTEKSKIEKTQESKNNGVRNMKSMILEVLKYLGWVSIFAGAMVISLITFAIFFFGLFS